MRSCKTTAEKLVGRLLRLFSLQANSKTREGTSHPDRNDQFEHINAQVAAFQAAGEPAISVDTKKKELVGDFKNGGRELRRKASRSRLVHDFVIPELGKVVPYGVYDIAANTGWVSFGITHDTAAFAVESIRRWWHECGSVRYPTATRLLITADCGGSNGVRVRLWKRELQVCIRQARRDSRPTVTAARGRRCDSDPPSRAQRHHLPAPSPWRSARRAVGGRSPSARRASCRAGAPSTMPAR